MGAVRFINTPFGRAFMVAVGFTIFLLTFVFFSSGIPVIIGSALGLVVMLIPFGLGGSFRRDGEATPDAEHSRPRPGDIPPRRSDNPR